jgi:DNA-binding transcriptional MocR family regulator
MARTIRPRTGLVNCHATLQEFTMTIWPPSPDRMTRPAYRAIAQALVEAVEAGEVADGTRLPPQRTLAYRLGVSVQTVSRAYEELTRIGLVRGEVGRGSFVTLRAFESRVPWQRTDGAEDLVDFSMLVPVLAPRHEQAMRAALAGLAADLPHEVYGSFRPRKSLRRNTEAARSWLGRCGLTVPQERIVATNGSTAAMTVALMTAAMPGDVLLVEEVGHHTIGSLATALGIKAQAVPMDGEGILPEAVDEAAAKGARALFVMPAGLGPTGAFMGEARRDALVAVARRRDLLIVENDAWGPLVDPEPRPLAARAPERVLYFTGVSKCAMPGLRIGWLVVPDRLTPAARTRHLITAWMATPLVAEVATRWIRDGTLDEMLAFQRAQFARRNAIARRLLEGLDFVASDTGMHVWLRLPAPWHRADFVAHARNDRVAVAGSRSFALEDQRHDTAIRICLGGVDERQLRRGLRTITMLARSAPVPALLTM